LQFTAGAAVQQHDVIVEQSIQPATVHSRKCNVGVPARPRNAIKNRDEAVAPTHRSDASLWERPPGRDPPPKNRDEAVAPTVVAGEEIPRSEDSR
jgi:hypothetical protein